jgi:hypothetical protein
MEQQIRDFLHTKMPRIAADIEALFRNSIRITTKAVDNEETLPVGSSKIGGTPDLPPDISWPEWKGVPLAFIAQINLRDTAQLDSDDLLPKSGLLSFFYEATDTPWGFDPIDRGSACVLYFEEVAGKLVRAVQPAHLPEYSRFKPCTLEWSTEITIPERGSYYIDVLELTSDPERWQTDYNGRFEVVKEVPISERPDPTNKEEEHYDDLTSLIGDSYNEPVHRLLGYSDNIQGSMELECQLGPICKL